MRFLLPSPGRASGLTGRVPGRRAAGGRTFRPTLQILEDRVNLNSTSLFGAAAHHVTPNPVSGGPITFPTPIVLGLKPPPPGDYGPMSSLGFATPTGISRGVSLTAAATAVTAKPHPASVSPATVAALHTVTLP